MMKPDPMTLARILHNKITALHEEGDLKDVRQDPDLGYSCEDVFGFSADAVEGIHSHRIGVGDGLWFRLNDGRVIGGDREEYDPDPAAYDTVEN